MEYIQEDNFRIKEINKLYSMLFKINKDKENAKTERLCWIPACSPSTSEYKSRHYGNTAILSMTLHSNNKLLKIRKNSNFNPRPIDAIEVDSLQSVHAKRISLCDNRQRSKNKSCRSASSHHQKSVLQESNFDALKQEARKLEEETSFCALYRWRPSVTKPTMLLQKDQKDQNTNIIQTVKKSKKTNMRKIIKGRPEIKKLLQENRDRILKQKTIQYQECIFTENYEPKTYPKLNDQLGSEACLSVLNTIL